MAKECHFLEPVPFDVKPTVFLYEPPPSAVRLSTMLVYLVKPASYEKSQHREVPVSP